MHGKGNCERAHLLRVALLLMHARNIMPALCFSQVEFRFAA
jgi:hypothetical protein